MHDIAGVGITIATILAATFFSHQSANNMRSELRGEINSLKVELRSEMSGLRSEMYGIRAELLGRFDSIQKDMREFYAEQARHDVRISNLEQQHKN